MSIVDKALQIIGGKVSRIDGYGTLEVGANIQSTSGDLTITGINAGNIILNAAAGKVGIGISIPTATAHIADTTTNSSRGLIIQQSNTGIQAAATNFLKSRGTFASPTSVADGDYISVVDFRPYTSTSLFIRTAGFGARVNGSVSGTSAPSDIFFYTTTGTDDGDPYNNNHIRMIIMAAGNIGIGTTTPNELLGIEGRISLRETTSPSATSNYGKLYVKSSDSNLYFMNDSGTETNLLAGGGGGTPGGSNTYIQFNNAGAFGGSSNFTYDVSTSKIGLSASTVIYWAGAGDSNWRSNYENSPSGAQFITSSGIVDTIYGGSGSASSGYLLRNTSNLSILELSGDRSNGRFSVSNFSFTGNVGIGTNTPSKNLHVMGATLLDNRNGGGTTITLDMIGMPVIDGDNRVILQTLDSSTMTAGVGGGFTFGALVNASSTSFYGGAGIRSSKETSTNDDYATSLLFATRVNATPMSEKMRITGAGNVGIGTTNPLNKLTVATDGTAAIPTISIGGTADPDTGWYHPAANTQAWSVGGQEALRITSSAVSLGATIPAIYNLNVDDGGIGAFASSSTMAAPAILAMERSRGTLGSRSAISANDEIGSIRFKGFTDDSYVAAEIKVVATTGWGSSGADSPGNLLFLTTSDGYGAAVERMRIDSTGNVGIGTAAAHSTLQVIGSISKEITSVVSNTTLSNIHYTVLVDATAGNTTITLPSISGIKGRMYNIVKIDNSVNTVIIDGAGSEKISGYLTETLTAIYESITIQTDGATGWYIL